MPISSVRDVLRGLERAPVEEMWTALAFLAGGGVELVREDVNAAVRRAELLLAAGGDPHRPLELYGRAVGAIADDLDAPAAREQLAHGLAALEPETSGLRGAGEALRLLRADPDLAWQAYAAALLADALGGDAAEPA